MRKFITPIITLGIVYAAFLLVTSPGYIEYQASLSDTPRLSDGINLSSSSERVAKELSPMASPIFEAVAGVGNEVALPGSEVEWKAKLMAFRTNGCHNFYRLDNEGNIDRERWFWACDPSAMDTGEWSGIENCPYDYCDIESDTTYRVKGTVVDLDDTYYQKEYWPELDPLLVIPTIEIGELIRVE